MVPIDLSRGRFSFRFEHGNHEHRVWFEMGGVGEFGLVIVSTEELVALNEHIEAAAGIVLRARQRAELAAAQPEGTATPEASEATSTSPPHSPDSSATARSPSTGPTRQLPARRRRTN